MQERYEPRTCSHARLPLWCVSKQPLEWDFLECTLKPVPFPFASAAWRTHEKLLAEQALIPAKEAKELLFRLVADGIVTVQEVPRRVDRHPQFTFYAFQADFDHLCSLFTDTCHRSLLNLRRRRHMEVARHRATTEELVNACGNVAPSLEEGTAISGTNVSESAEAMHARLVRNAEMQETNVAKMLAAESRLDETLFILRDLHWRLWMMASLRRDGLSK